MPRRRADSFASRQAARGERGAFHRLMAGIAIGDRYKLHRGSGGFEQRGGSGGADIAIVGMRAEGDHANVAFVPEEQLILLNTNKNFISLLSIFKK